MIPSNVNTPLDVPIKPVTDILAVPDLPVPRMPMHPTDVCVIQLVVKQSATASVMVTVASVEPNCAPASVTLAIMVATLYGDNAVITGSV